jgi:hypothetical protein
MDALSKAKRRHYKAGLALLPPLDHVGDGLGEADFKICAYVIGQRRRDRLGRMHMLNG